MLSAEAESGEEPAPEVTTAERQKFEKLTGTFEERVIREALPNFDQIRKTEVAHIRMQAGWDGTAPSKRPYKMSMVELTQLRERLDELLAKGYIRPSSSPFSAPVLMVPKPEKTAFTSPYGQYEWLVMPMGLANSPSCYRRRMQRALGHLPFVKVFIDDCIIASHTLEEHYSHIQQFLEVCEEQGIYLKKSKCQLLQTQIRFLGHVVSRKGSQPQHDKLAAIRDWPDLEHATHARQFLGLAGYYRRYVLGFSEIAHPLTQLTKGDAIWEWGATQKWAFEEIKAASCVPPLSSPFQT
ncbi:hypothetical protein CYMTET_17517 [Cymbomonas tetramitiformis]|uniref:Reverse transcriptase domain-containing protein n=1 Tax=Cymbomonas tetramitiformis TaxID=36881 RepID=A0AAE0GA73_9CHLO|nr:hypothetical protein CYMTET_17517 [Cymbomonas tetramitiformis]